MLEEKRLLSTVIDVWSGEPDLNADLHDYVSIATPHIAGHSFNAKLKGTLDCYNSLCDFFLVNNKLENFKVYEKKEDLFHYNTKHRRDIKKKLYKEHLVDNHHIIPKEFNNHPLLRELQVDTSCSKNIIFLPNRYAKEWIGHEEWIFHTSHPKYNKYVLKELNSIHQLNDKENRYYQFSLFFMYLHQSLEHNEPNIKKLFS